MIKHNNGAVRAERSKPQKIITDYKKAYEELKAKVKAYELLLKEKDQLILEDETRLLRLKEETRPKLIRVTSARTLKYNLIRSSRKQGEYQKQGGERNKEKILQCLARTYPNGQSSSDLENSTELSRYSVRKHCRELKQIGFVHKDKGKYYLTQMALGYPKLQAHLLEMIGYDSLISRYTSPTSSIKEKLRALVAAFGVYNTYIMLEAVLDQKLHTFVGTNIPAIDKIPSLLAGHRGGGEDSSVRARIETAINPMQMFSQLCRLVIAREEVDRHGSSIQASDTPTITPSEPIPSESLLEKNMTAFEAYRRALTDLYPEGTSELERIRKEEAPEMARSHLKETYNRQRKAASTGEQAAG